LQALDSGLTNIRVKHNNKETTREEYAASVGVRESPCIVVVVVVRSSFHILQLKVSKAHASTVSPLPHRYALDEDEDTHVDDMSRLMMV
jgi:hypothetical protein